MKKLDEKNLFIEEFKKIQSKILDTIINIIALFGLPVILMELIQGFEENIFFAPFFYLFAEIIFIFLAFFKKKLDFKIKNYLTMIFIFFISTYALMTHGLSGGGSVLFVIFILLASILLHKRDRRIAIFSVVIVFAVVGVVMVKGIIPITTEAMITSIKYTSWAMAVFIFLMISLGFIFIADKIQKQFLEILKKSQSNKEKLKNEIKNRKKSEKKLKESQRRLKSIMKNLPGMAYRCKNNRNYTMEFISSGAEKLTGYKIEEILDDRNIPYGKIIHPDDRDIVWNKVQNSVKETKQFEITYRIITKEDEIKWVWERGNGIFDEEENLKYLEGIISDVTKRINAEKNLEKEKDFIKRIMDTSPVAITRVGRDGKIEYANKAAEDLFDLKRKNIKEYSYNDEKWDITDFEGNPYPESQLPYYIVKRTHRPVYDVKHTIKIMGNERKYLSINASPIIDKNDNFDGMVAVIQDITEKIQTEKEKAKLQKENLRLQKMDALGTLAGGIAHDFNNLLFAMMGNIELAITHKDSDRFDEFLNKAKKSGQKAKELIKQILTFSREQNLNQEFINIVPVIKETIKLLENIIPSNIKLEKNISDEEIVVYSNPSHINQIIMNLGTNAYHAMEKEGGKLTIGLKKLGLEKNNKYNLERGEYAELIVKDTGKGIEKAKLDKIFLPFYTTKSDKEGTGLGLSTVDGIVKSLDGKILVDSKKDKGTKFTVLLPVSEASEAEKEEAEIKIERKNFRIIYVDDNETLTDLVKTTLSNYGCEVKIFNNPLKAHEYIKKKYESIDAFIFDQTMPDLTGEELTRKIRDEGIEVPVFILTGYSNVLDKEEAQEIGVSEFFYKPIEITELYKKIYKFLEEE